MDYFACVILTVKSMGVTPLSEHGRLPPTESVPMHSFTS